MPWATGRGSREGFFCDTKGVADELLRPASPRGEGRDITTEMVRDKLAYTTKKNVATQNPVPRFQRCASLECMSVDRNKRPKPDSDSDSQDESRAEQGEWKLVSKKSKPANREDHPSPPKQDQTNDPAYPPMTSIPKILVPYTAGFESALHLAETIESSMEGTKMQMKFLASGNVLMSPPDLKTYEHLLKIQEVKGLPVQLKAAGQGTSKGILMKFPVLMPLKPILDHPQVLEAKRCRIYSGEETRQVEITVQGHLPGFLQLGSWGTFFTRPYSREPLRCYNCQRYGHHKNNCNLGTRCGVCSGPHKTELCITKHKDGQETTLKCPNCKETHLAWSKVCVARRTLVDAQRETQIEFMASFRPALAAQSNWGEKRPAQPQDIPQPSITPSNQDFPALGQGAVRKYSPHQPRTRLEAPPPKQTNEEEEKEENISLTKNELKELFTTFAGALAGMLGHTIQEEKLSEMADKIIENKIKTKKTRKTPAPTPATTTQQLPPGTTPATAAIEAEKAALGLTLKKNKPEKQIT